MSQIHGHDGSTAEPNLTPLLDVVLQLLMFFMMCVNFITEQVNEDIRLPVAQSARPMEKSEVDVLFLNVDPQGRLVIPGRERALTTQGEINFYLRQQYADARRLAEAKGDASGKVRTAVIIRGDRDANFAHIYQVLRACKDTGYTKIQMRALTKGGG
jgi:biopolymer transport protein ExbD